MAANHFLVFSHSTNGLPISIKRDATTYPTLPADPATGFEDGIPIHTSSSDPLDTDSVWLWANIPHKLPYTYTLYLVLVKTDSVGNQTKEFLKVPDNEIFPIQSGIMLGAGVTLSAYLDPDSIDEAIVAEPEIILSGQIHKRSIE